MKTKKLTGYYNQKFVKAQASTEVMLIIAAIVLLFITLLLVYQGQIINLQQIIDRVDGNNAVYRIAAAINYIYLAGDGTSYNTTVIAPRANISVSGRIIVAEENGARFEFPLLVNVTQTNVNNSGSVLIRNVGGNIVIN